MKVIMLIVGLFAFITGLWMLGLSFTKACKHLKGDHE